MTDSSDKSGNYLTGRILLAMPGMTDPRFHRAVVFMCAHDKGGAMGLVVNHALPGLDMSQLLEHMELLPEDGKGAPEAPVLSGGPVETARGFILHTGDFKQGDTVKISEGFCVTGTIDALRAIATGEGPEKMLFILGYAGWSAGQLDEEIRQNAWLITEADPDLIFSGGADDKWERAIRKLGVDPAMLSGESGRA